MALKRPGLRPNVSVRVLALLVVAGGLAGCATGDGTGGNPNLLAPKVVVHPRPDGNVTVFVHGAFREQLYDFVAIRIDNASVTNRTWVLSAEVDAPTNGFFLEVEAGAGETFYRSQARVDINWTAERARVAFLTAQGWDEPRAFALPFEHIVDRPREVDA